jgi:ATP-binding cassette, subfamily B, bacterial HlyB/CyaB
MDDTAFTQHRGTTIDTGLACLAVVVRFLGKPADPEHLRHRYGSAGRADLKTLQRAARHLGLRAKIVTARRARLAKTPLPAIAECRDGTFVIIARAAEQEVLIHDPRHGRASTQALEAFVSATTGRLLLLVTRAHLAGDARRFGLTWFIPPVVKYRWLLGEVLVASFFLQLFALVTPLFFQVVIDKVLVHRGLTTLDVLVFGLAVIGIFDAVLGGLRAYLFAHTTNRIDVELGARLFHHLLGLPLAYFESRRVGNTVARVREQETIRHFLTSSTVTVVIDLVFTVVFLAVMYSYSGVLTAIVVGSLPFYVALSLVITPLLRRRLDEKFHRGAENQALLVEAVSGVETVKAMAVEPRLQHQWEEQLAAYVRAAFRVTTLGETGSQVAGLINRLSVAAILWYGARLVIDGHLTVGELVAFNMLAGRVSAPVLRLAHVWQEFQQVRIAIERLGDILNTPPEPGPGPGRAALPAIRGHVMFDHVRFRYRPDAPVVLHDVSLDIPPGQVIGIVGPSGSGKSTLTKLVQRLHVPESGRVLVDGVDLAMVDPSWLRRQIGVVLQENVLFNRSVRANIALTDPGMELARVVRAAALAGAHEFILELPYGYDTVIGERGATLSGGQRQRLAIARAIVTDPRILVFDEATSALDYESERVIQDNLRAICQGRTVLIIAHRLAAVRACDRIITIEAGRIVEDGTHDELLRCDGRYAALYRHQAGNRAGHHVG